MKTTSVAFKDMEIGKYYLIKITHNQFTGKPFETPHYFVHRVFDDVDKCCILSPANVCYIETEISEIHVIEG